MLSISIIFFFVLAHRPMLSLFHFIIGFKSVLLTRIEIAPFFCPSSFYVRARLTSRGARLCRVGLVDATWFLFIFIFFYPQIIIASGSPAGRDPRSGSRTERWTRASHARFASLLFFFFYFIFLFLSHPFLPPCLIVLAHLIASCKFVVSLHIVISPENVRAWCSAIGARSGAQRYTIFNTTGLPAVHCRRIYRSSIFFFFFS